METYVEPIVSDFSWIQHHAAFKTDAGIIGKYESTIFQGDHGFRMLFSQSMKSQKTASVVRNVPTAVPHDTFQSETIAQYFFKFLDLFSDGSACFQFHVCFIHVFIQIGPWRNKNGEIGMYNDK